MTIVKRFIASGFWLMFLAALVFSLADILTKYLTSLFSTMEISLIRFLFGGLLLWPVLSSRGISLRGHRPGLLILRGLCGTLSYFCLLISIASISLSNAIVLFYTFPLFVVFFSFLFFRITIELGELFLIGLGLTGIYILINPGFHSFNTGYIFGILSSCIGGMAMVFAHKARQTNGPLIIYFYFCLVGGILSLPSFVRGFKIPNAQHGILLISLSLTLLIGQVLMNYALKFCKASEGALIMMSEVVFAGVAAILIFRDPISLNFLIGAILIMGSGIGLNLMGRKSRRSPAFSEENMDK